jgi:hypothetical protein
MGPAGPLRSRRHSPRRGHGNTLELSQRGFDGLGEGAAVGLGKGARAAEGLALQPAAQVVEEVARGKLAADIGGVEHIAARGEDGGALLDGAARKRQVGGDDERSGAASSTIRSSAASKASPAMTMEISGWSGWRR